jgi:hypothetical protein
VEDVYTEILLVHVLITIDALMIPVILLLDVFIPLITFLWIVMMEINVPFHLAHLPKDAFKLLSTALSMVVTLVS